MKAIRSDSELLLACLDGRPDKLARISECTQQDWEELVRAAASTFVLPAMHQRLDEVGVQAPPEIARFLEGVEDLNCERNMRILEEIRDVACLLNEAGIEPVALKGAAFLLTGVYPKLGCRYLCDLDLLVPSSQLGAAAEALERDGYAQDRRDPLARFRHHYPQLQRPRGADGSGSVPVELHHSLGHGLSRKLLPGEDMHREARVMEWRGVRIRIPSPEHLVTHLILHSQVHHSYSERIWPPLRAIYDLAVIDRHFGARLNWNEVRERFRVRGQESSLLLHLLQTRETLGMPLPFTFELDWIGKTRWARRQALHRWPASRFADPVYLASATLSRRFQFLTSIVSASGGWKYAAQTLFRPGFYRRLLAEIALR